MVAAGRTHENQDRLLPGGQASGDVRLSTAAAGVPDVFVSQMMGHAGGLLQTYSRAILDFRRDAIRNMEESRRNAISLIPGIPNQKTLQ